jgi:hypothetical protein
MVATFQRSQLLIFYNNDIERRARRRSKIQPMELQRTYNIMAMQAWIMFGCWLVAMLEWMTLEAESAFDNTVFVAVMAVIVGCIALAQIRGSYVLGNIQNKK